MQKEVRLTDEQWTVVMQCLNGTPTTGSETRQEVAARILTQLRCHEALQTMAPACIVEGEQHGA